MIKLAVEKTQPDDTMISGENQESLGSLFFGLISEMVKDGIPEEEKLPQAVEKHLQELSLLYGVPYPNLVPSADLLPPESIRFFYLNSEWIFSLLDGALSPGRDIGIDHRMDASLIEGVIKEILGSNHNIRRELQGKTPLPSFDAEGSFPVCTGFLLRSGLVSGWRGLEFKAFQTDVASPLTCLRLETLSQDVLIGLYRGRINTLEIAQPPESFHFGFTAAAGRPDQFEKTLRSESDGTIDPSRTIPISLRGRKEDRVVNLKAAAEDMSSSVGHPVTPAWFALHMIQNAFTGVLEIK